MLRNTLIALLAAGALAGPLAVAPAAVYAQPAAVDSTARDSLFTVERFLELEQAGDPQISPDGSRIAFTRSWINAAEDRWDSAIWIMNADGSQKRFFVEGSSPRWSPDGSRIAYTAEGEPSGAQIWVRYVDLEGPSTQVTRVTESPGDIGWSPDGTRIGFTKFVPHDSRWNVDLPSPPEGGKWTDAPRHIESLHYRQDRRGFTESGFTHLFTVNAEGGTPRQLTEGEWNVGARFDQMAFGANWDWSPDGSTIVVEGFRADPDSADLNYRDANLYAVEVASRQVRQLTGERGTWSNPVFSPDGRRIAFTGQPYSTMSYRADDLYVMDANGANVQRLSVDLDRDPGNLSWARDGNGIYFTAQNEGSSNLYLASTRGGVRELTDGVHMFSLGSIARDGRMAVGTRSSFQEPTDIVRLDLRRPADMTQLTDLNADLLAEIQLGEVEEIWYTSADGTRVQGWIVKPPFFDESRSWPLIMEIHGGPHGMYNVGFNPMFQNFAANGFVVLYTNPRGSTGYGTDFGNAIQRAYPSVDYDDLMAGVDEVVSRGYIDQGDMFVGGCSGGGVLSSWVIGHTTRFAAAAVRCPVINWMSFIGQTDVPLFTQNFFEQPFWENPEPWLRQSPLMYVGNVETPTLLMTGELDLRTPIAQSDEYFAALQLRGVPSAMLRFQGEYHGTGSKPSNWMRTQLYMMDWYRRWGSLENTGAAQAD